MSESDGSLSKAGIASDYFVFSDFWKPLEPRPPVLIPRPGLRQREAQASGLRVAHPAGSSKTLWESPAVEVLSILAARTA